MVLNCNNSYLELGNLAIFALTEFSEIVILSEYQNFCDHDNVIKFPCSRGVSGALYLQSATVGVMFFLRVFSCRAALCKWR